MEKNQNSLKETLIYIIKKKKMNNYQYLNKVNFPSDIKKLSIDELKILIKRS